MLTRVLSVFLACLLGVAAPAPVLSAIFMPETENAPLPTEEIEEKQDKLSRKKKTLEEPELTEIASAPPRFVPSPPPKNPDLPQSIYRNLPKPPLRLLI